MCFLFQFGNILRAKWSLLLCFRSLPPRAQFVIWLIFVRCLSLLLVATFSLVVQLSLVILTNLSILIVYFYPNHSCCHWKRKPITFCAQGIFFLRLVSQSTITDLAGQMRWVGYSPEEVFIWVHVADLRGFQVLLSSYPANFIILLCEKDPLGRIYLTVDVRKQQIFELS